MARDLYDDHFKAVESMPRGVVVTLRNIATQLESAWELHTNRQASIGQILTLNGVPTSAVLVGLENFAFFDSHPADIQTNHLLWEGDHVQSFKMGLGSIYFILEFVIQSS